LGQLLRQEKNQLVAAYLLASPNSPATAGSVVFGLMMHLEFSWLLGNFAIVGREIGLKLPSAANAQPLTVI